MAIKVRTKKEVATATVPPVQQKPSLRIPRITGSPKKAPNIIIRAVKIMLMDIKMLLHPKQTKEELEKYSQFSDLVYGRK